MADSAPETAAETIVVDGVSKTFSRGPSAQSVMALGDVSLTFPANGFVTIFGPSGCGKTTLLRLIGGLLQPDSGEISVYGRKPAPGAGTGFVFQSFRLLPWRTVRDNVGFPLEIQGIGGEARRARVDDYLSRVGLADFAESFPSELSGGMNQRVALARALVAEPRLLLMDEPFASLDAQTREFMQMELLRLWRQKQGEVIFVTHSVDEAISLSDRIVVMSPRPGRVVEIVEVDLPRPRWEYDLRARPEFNELRAHLWGRIKEMVGPFEGAAGGA